MIYIQIGVLALAGAIAWWITGFDKSVDGSSKRGHYLTRALRCVFVVFMVKVLIIAAMNPGYDKIPHMIIAPACIALALVSSVSEVFTGWFMRLIDPMAYDHREFDPSVATRYEAEINELIHTGRREAAIELCERLKVSGEVSVTKLEDYLEFLGVKQNRVKYCDPLVEVSKLRQAGNFVGAEEKLKSLLAKNPRDEGAAIMLMRVYAQDLRQPTLARQVLTELARQPKVTAAYVDFARHSIDEWSKPPPKAPAPPAVEELTLASLEGLIERGQLGTAIEMLQKYVRVHPNDFELRLKLAEVYGAHCGDLAKAEQIVRELDFAGKFDAQQIALARKKLREWGEGKI